MSSAAGDRMPGIDEIPDHDISSNVRHDNNGKDHPPKNAKSTPEVDDSITVNPEGISIDLDVREDKIPVPKVFVEHV